MKAAQLFSCAAYDTGRQRGGGGALQLWCEGSYGRNVARVQLSNMEFTELCYFDTMTLERHFWATPRQGSTIVVTGSPPAPQEKSLLF